MRDDNLTTTEVWESLLLATRIAKVIRSRHAPHGLGGEKLYVIKSSCLSGTQIYTKGTFRKDEDAEIFYILISSKVSTD